jgi:hypothetical protein
MGTRFRAGDIIVTPVGRHYAIGRIKTADRILEEPIATERDRESALALACRLAGSTHRVFLWTTATHRTLAQVDCGKTPP